MELNNEANNMKSPSDRWETFDVVATRKDSRKASLFSAPGNLEVSATSNSSPTKQDNEAVKNDVNNGDVTLLNNNGKAPKRRLSSYTSSAIEAVRKGGRKRSSQVSNGMGEWGF